MAAIYHIPFYNDLIEVTVTKNSTYVNTWIVQTIQAYRRRLHKLVVGLDIEWLPCFNEEDNHPVALLQLCIGRRCLLFQLLHADGIPLYLVDFLRDPNIKFVGVGVGGDAQKLLRDHGLFVANTVDLNQLALLVYGEEVYGRMGWKRMANTVLGKVMEKPKNVTLSKWDAEDLSYEQVEYGCIDALMSFEIGNKLYLMLSEREASRVRYFGELTNCHHHQQPWLLLQDTQGMFQKFTLASTV